MLEYALLFCPSAERVCEANGQIGYERKQSWYPSCLAIVIPEEPLFGLFALLLRVDRAPRENLEAVQKSLPGSTSTGASLNASCKLSENVAVRFSNSTTATMTTTTKKSHVRAMPRESTSIGVFPECLMQAFGEHSSPILQLGDLQSCMAVPRIDRPIVRGTRHWKPHKI